MRRFFLVLLVLVSIGLLWTPTTSHAQTPSDQGSLNDLNDLRGALQNMSTTYADRYVQPATDLFGANMNGGLFRTADVGAGFLPLLPFDVYLGLSVSGTFTSSLDESFTLSEGTPVETPSPNTTAELVLDGEAPTIAGQPRPGEGTLRLVFRDQDDNVIRDEQLGPALQGLLDTPIAPVPVPQLGVGSIAGTDVQLRYFPQSELSYGGGSYGQVGLFGLAVRHDIDQWFPAPLPINIAVQGAWNQFSLANDFDGETQEVVSASGWAFNVQASKGVPVIPLVFYGGLQYEKFNMTYDYTFDINDPNVSAVDISLDQTAANRFRALAGFSFTLAVVRFNVDYAIGSDNNVLTTGLGVRL